MKFSHTTVLQNEMVSHVLTNTNGTYVDCTLGGGGHSLALAEGLSNLGCIIGVDQDGEAIEAAKERLRGAQCKFISVRDKFFCSRDWSAHPGSIYKINNTTRPTFFPVITNNIS